MNLSWLEDFLALAASGNFSRAAEDRHMTQPAFSRRIRALEEWLGADLFDRSMQPARLTPAGEWLRPQAEDLLARVAALPPQAREQAQANATTLRLAATHALSFTFVPGWLQPLQEHTTAGPVRLVSDVLARCEALLLQRQVQFVIAHAPAGTRGELDAAGVPSVLVGEDLLLPVHAPGAPEGALLAFSDESGLGRIVRQALGSELPMRAVFTASLASVLKTMALDGRGLAWLPQSLVREELSSGRLLVAAPERWRLPVEIRLYRDPQPMTAHAEAFWRAASGGGGVRPAALAPPCGSGRPG